MTNRVQELQDALVEKMVASLEQGLIEGKWTKPWVTLRHKNVVTNKVYDGRNAINLMLSGQECPYWGTFLQWKTAGYVIPEGTRAGGFVYGKPAPITKEKDGEEYVAFVHSKAYVVFNGTQVVDKEGKSFTWEAQKVVPKLPEVEAYFDRHPVKVHHTRPYAAYDTSRDEIFMPPINLFDDNIAYYATLAHEFIHWTGHKSRLYRNELYNYHETKSRAFEELVAEFGAAMLGANLEMAVEPRPDHLEYLASWLKAIKEDKTVLQRTIAAASKAVSYIDTDPAAVSA